MAAGDIAGLAHKYAVLRRHCAAVGRDYAGIHRVTRKWCVIRDTDDAAVAAIPPVMKQLFAAAKRESYFDVDLRISAGSVADFAILGGPETVRASIERYAAIGVDELQLVLADAAPEESMRYFAREFIR